MLNGNGRREKTVVVLCDRQFINSSMSSTTHLPFLSPCLLFCAHRPIPCYCLFVPPCPYTLIGNEPKLIQTSTFPRMTTARFGVCDDLCD